MSRVSYVPHRGVLYGIIWVFAVIELGLTAYRINQTENVFDNYDPIIVALLVTSILTITWIPVTFLLHRTIFGSSDSTSTSKKRFRFLHGETARSVILWIMWLVCAAIATHKWPTRAYAGPGKQGSIILTILAFAWMIFGLLTIAKMFSAMEYAAVRAVGEVGGREGEKNVNGTAANGIANGAAGPAENV